MEGPQVPKDSSLVENNRHPDRIRNVVFLGSSGHGKSTIYKRLVTGLAEELNLQVNPSSLADFDPQEEIRGITLRQSVCTLTVRQPTPLVLNLINTPGNSEFEGDALSSLKLADGAVWVVDVAEGLLPHTEDTLIACIKAKVRPILVLNKIDRLLQELNLDVNSVFSVLKRQILEFNVLLSKLDIFMPDQTTGFEPFDPAVDNVIFSSSNHGWGFTLQNFVHLYASKFGIAPDRFREKIWVDYYFDVRQRKFIDKPLNSEGEPLQIAFIQFVLEPIRNIYEVIYSRDKNKIERTIDR